MVINILRAARASRALMLAFAVLLWLQVSLQAQGLKPNAKPLFWADGITQISELGAYKAQGFNTVVVRLTWTPADNGEISALDLAPQRAFAEAAAQRGLGVIYAIPAAPTGLDTQFRLAADSDAYISLWTTWLQDAVASLKNTPGLLGWMLPDDPRGLPLFDDTGFRRWLSQNYANLDVINRQWHANWKGFDDVSLFDVEQLIGDWKGNTSLSEEEISANLPTVRRTYGRNWAFHPAALAVASYKWDAYRALLTAWVGALRGEDGAHLVFSGRMPDYAQLLSLPSGIDVSMPDMAPSVAENDIVTHNPQAIDIARRGGKFAVVPMFSPRESLDLPAAALPDLSRRWMEEACARGARGVAFDSWQTLRETATLARSISDEISKLSAPAYAKIWGEAPVNTSAVLLSPLAEGTVAQIGVPPQSASRGLYGFGDDLVSGEPANLVWMLRWGTAFGGVDYLSPDDLGEASIDHYTTLLAPQALSATADVTAHLSSYVAGGGVLVADLGLGALQNGGQVNALSPPLANLFGVPSAFEVQPLSFNLNGASGHPLFPDWSGRIELRPGLALTMGDGPNQAAFAGPVGLSLAAPPPGVTVLAMGPRLPQTIGTVKRVLSSQLTINSVGQGHALFAPFRLWSFWRPGQPGFDAFFGDLMSRGATVGLAGSSALVPSPVNAAIGQTLFPEIANRATGVTLTNHNAPGEAGQMAALQTASAGDWLWSGAIVHLSPRADFEFVGGRPAPIDNGSELEERARPVSLHAVLLPGQTQPMSMRPIAAQNLAGGPIAAEIVEESARRLKINCWPGALTVLIEGEKWQPTVTETGAPTRLTVVSSPDGYVAAPGTRHRVRVIDYAKSLGKKGFATTEKIVTANADGRLIIEFSGGACAVDIAPAA